MERTFALYSPIVDSIKVTRSGKVRRAKLYYLRERTGKSARISEKIKKKIGIELDTKTEDIKEQNLAAESINKEQKDEIDTKKKEEVSNKEISKEKK